MFIIEDFFLTRKDKIDAWKEDRARWVNDRKEDQYGYRTNQKYEQIHPYPVVDLVFIARWVGLVLVCLAVVAAIVGLAMNHKGKPAEPKKEEVKVVQADGTQCGDKLKINDHVRIQYGDYADKQGRVIGGCKADEKFQIKLDDKQTIDGEYHSSTDTHDKVDVSGKIIPVDSNGNLVVIP